MLWRSLWASRHAEGDHRWTFAILATGWAAACPCGLGVVITEQADGRQRWRWRKGGVVVPPARCVGAAHSLRAQLHGLLLDSERPSKN